MQKNTTSLRLCGYHRFVPLIWDKR